MSEIEDHAAFAAAIDLVASASAASLVIDTGEHLGRLVIDLLD